MQIALCKSKKLQYLKVIMSSENYARYNLYEEVSDLGSL